MIPRGLFTLIQKDLTKKMVFLGGPRQVGKTTLAKSLLGAVERGRYLNWDSDEDRRAILEKRWHEGDRLLVFDELHKYPRWKNWLKGLYDTVGERHQFLVTGSARLDVYRRGGDSLMGRYHYWRLHPLTLDEVCKQVPPKEAFERLMRIGGFPEPFLDNNETEARRWRRERFDRILKDDIRDLEAIREIQLLSLFVDELRKRVGAPVVLSNLARDLEISPRTAKLWLEALERMYLLFIVRPYTKNLPRAIQKPPKVYFFDNGDVLGDEGAVFENLVATHLIKRLHFIEDSEGYRMSLHYLRDKEGREVDFAVLKGGRLISLVEAKLSDQALSRSLEYYAERLKPLRAHQVVGELKNAYSKGRLEVLGAVDYLLNLKIE